LKLSIFQLKRHVSSKQNGAPPIVSILSRDLTLIFSRMLENLIAGSIEKVN